MKAKAKKVFIALSAIILFFALWWGWSWQPVTERFTVHLDSANDAHIRLVLITDLHSCRYGKGQRQLKKMIDREKPDFVVLSGDIFDDKIPDTNAELLTEYLAEKYPCFYVTGNHEYWSRRGKEIKKYLKEKGVNVLEGNCKTIYVRGQPLDIAGVDDPVFTGNTEWRKQLGKAWAQSHEGHIKILASHRPERVADYENYGFDLILSGHAHSGQIWIPFIKRGMYAPNQGFFAKYVNGHYTLSNGSHLVVSRGLARESTPLPRFFNHPEIVTVDIR